MAAWESGVRELLRSMGEREADVPSADLASFRGTHHDPGASALAFSQEQADRLDVVGACPSCGGDLTAICLTPVEYRIVRTDARRQEWNRLEVDDDSAEVQSVVCEDCRRRWDRPIQNASGEIVALGEESETLSPPIGQGKRT